MAGRTYTVTTFWNMLVITINRSRPFYALLEELQGKRMTISSAIGQLASFMDLQADKRIMAYLVSRSGNIIVVESIRDQTFVVGKRENAKLARLTCGINRITDLEVTSIHQTGKPAKLLEMLRNGLAELRADGRLRSVEGRLPFRDVTYEVQIDLEHHDSLEALLGQDTVALEEEGSGARSASDDATVLNASLRPVVPPPAPAPPVPVPTPPPAVKPVVPPRRRVGGPFQHPEPGVVMTQDEIRKTLEHYAKDRVGKIEAIAASLSWGKGSTDKVMVGDGHYGMTRAGMTFSRDNAGGNKRGNFRLCFRTFPAMLKVAGEICYVNILNISENGAGFGVFVDPDQPVEPFRTGEAIELGFPLVDRNQLTVRGRIMRSYPSVDPEGRHFIYHGVQFDWPRKRAPMNFLETMQRTELFLLAHKDGGG
ncbi:MAG: PilZ domain-containing protein [Magnetococcales bacterium]|nr:PilZ domain-containing protein [Magnetococcales bacterium]